MPARQISDDLACILYESRLGVTHIICRLVRSIEELLER